MPSENAVADKRSTKLQTFLKRLLSTILLWAVVLGALFSGNQTIADFAVLIVINGICFFGLMEFCDMVEKRGGKCFRRFALTSGAIYITSIWLLAIAARNASISEVAFAVLPGAVAGVIVIALLVRRLFSTDMKDGTE